jgi:2-polyprenyl-3-methyl-5-hydroxy-6-metoxy-1,4-benzoquinol methylase
MRNRNQIRNLYRGYFDYRRVTPDWDGRSTLPRSISRILPPSRGASILDIGCGYGQFLIALQREGYRNIHGVEISKEAVAQCVKSGLDVRIIKDLGAFCKANPSKFDLIVMRHVLEHIDKRETVQVLRLIRRALTSGGSFFVTVPNGQSNTGAYWMYEDFTHETLFTAGSLLFVLRSAGFASIEFLDPDGLNDTRVMVRPIKKLLLGLYKANYLFWNRVTSSSFHAPSPAIFAFELKVFAR